MKPTPSNAVLLEKINNTHEVVVELKTGVDKQNGRVRSLEGWRNFLAGGMAIISVLILPIIFMLISNQL